MNGFQSKCKGAAAQLRPVLTLLEVLVRALEALGDSQASTIDVGDAPATPDGAERDGTDEQPVQPSRKGGSVKLTKPRGSGLVPGSD